MGPDEDIPDGAKFSSFRTWLMPFDSDDRDRKGLFLKRMYRKIAPWTTETRSSCIVYLPIRKW